MNWREDKTLIVLCFWVGMFGLAVLVVEVFWKEDVQLYSLFSQGFASFTGALLMLLKGEKAPPSGSTTTTTTEQVTKIPEEK